MEALFQHLLGAADWSSILSMFIFAVIGLALSLLLNSATRTVANPATPHEFEWSFFWRDNKRRIITNMLVIILGIRFYTEFGLITENFSTSAIGVGIGFCCDQIALVIKNKASIIGGSSLPKQDK